MIIPDQVRDIAKQVVTHLTDQMKGLIQGAITHMRGTHRRAYMAEVTVELLDGNARQAERVYLGGDAGRLPKGCVNAPRVLHARIIMPDVGTDGRRSNGPSWKPIFGHLLSP